MSHHIPEAVSWCLAAALVAVAVLLVRQRGITAAVRRRVAALEDSLQARDTEVRHLVTVRLPAVTASMHQPVPLPGLLDERLGGTVFAQGLQAVMDTFTQAVDKAQARADQSAKAALKASMRALQGLAHEQQLAISDMQERHDNPDVLRDLLQIDHANSQFGRRAQAIAVLCGSWPGRQRAASPLTDVVRGATSRIRDYRRVKVHNHADVAVVSRAVEPVVLAVAELLDNAARHSQPNTVVEVGLQPVHNGACVVIDDAGVGMNAQEVQRAAALLSGQRTVDVSRLGDPPQFGFPVIGVLASRYGFSVSVDTRSPYGGVRAVLFLPSVLLSQIDLDGPDTTPLAPPSRENGPARTAAGAVRAPEHRVPAPREHPEPAPDVFPPSAMPPADAGAVTGSTAGGLPKRRRRQPAPQQPAAPLPAERPAGPSAVPDGPPAPGPAAAAPERTAEETARRMGAFARGTRSGRADSTGPAGHPDPAPADDEGNPYA
ncbi:ATP-binding protein [Streptomyces sp. NPDC051162]|uniref:ATP-binding protein n=1 Tax=unclassified Streptomyces TaxID=2593676 RepID=UPI003441958D